MSESRPCQLCGRTLAEEAAETEVCPTCQAEGIQSAPRPMASAAELPQDFSSFQQQTSELPGAFSDAVLERVRAEAAPVATGPIRDLAWSIPAAILIWLFSIASQIIFQALGMIVWVLYEAAQGRSVAIQATEQPPALTIITVAAIFPAHLVTLLAAWAVVTRVGKQPFFSTLGWGWHRRFQPWHAFLFILLMIVVAGLAGRYLPHTETQVDRLLKAVPPVRYILAFIAVVTAPLVEEVIYRGVLFVPLERRFGSVLAVVVVSLLFVGVHVPQYWPSSAVIAVIMVLSVGLTVVRAYTHSILPCIVIHIFFNAIQAIPIITSR